MGKHRLALTVAALVLASGCSGGGGSANETPSTSFSARVPTVQPGAACLSAEQRAGVVRFSSSNGASLGGVVLGSGPAGVVLVHQSPGDVCQWLFYAEHLVGLGYQVIAFDLNGGGSSSPSAGNPSDPRFDLDVLAAAGELRSRGASEVVLIGASLGGVAVVTAAAAADPPVAGVIDLSSTAELSKMDALAAARELTVPALFMTGEHDTVTSAMRAMADAATRAPEHELVVSPGVSAHGVGLLKPESDPRAAENRATVEGFLARHTKRV